MYFGSDNQTGASETVFAALQAANTGVAGSYGDDQWTAKACQLICEIFETDADVFFVSTGTAANSLALACLAEPWDSILCHGQAHIINDELTAPEFFTGGARLIGLDAQAKKLSSEALQDHLAVGSAHPPHNSRATVLSLSQVNESGQIYDIDQIKALTAIARNHGLSVHMDGARFANAVAALNCKPADISWRAGVDVLCLGATKNGAIGAEAVIFFNKKFSSRFVQHRKRSGHLISKSRWMGAQFCGWLENNHWLQLAEQANQMAHQLAEGLIANEAAKVVWPVRANEVFAILPKALCSHLRNQGAVFYQWPSAFIPHELTLNDDEELVRFVTSFNTQASDVSQFLQLL